jgi:hypothetical protein
VQNFNGWIRLLVVQNIAIVATRCAFQLTLQFV